ncbi:MAG: hypothetical protein OEV55_08765 [candidate division Zixibacteria bacterium]|nr:hypothetical protein [candidate division Zixibacteria bacterium]
MRESLSDWIDRKEGFSSLGFTQQVKYLAYFYTKLTNDPIYTAGNIKDYFDLADVTPPSNVNQLCNNLVLKRVFVPVSNGYKLHRETFRELEHEFSGDKPKRAVSKKLRDLLRKVKPSQNRTFLSEAISCYEIGAYRAAIIMTWLLVVDNLYEYILAHKLTEFNGALALQNLKLKKITTKEDFNDLKEVKFIEIARSANIISNEVRKILDEKLGIRNTCAHPNYIIVKESKATTFIEDLVDNVLIKYTK